MKVVGLNDLDITEVEIDLENDLLTIHSQNPTKKKSYCDVRIESSRRAFIFKKLSKKSEIVKLENSGRSDIIIIFKGKALIEDLFKGNISVYCSQCKNEMINNICDNCKSEYISGKPKDYIPNGVNIG